MAKVYAAPVSIKPPVFDYKDIAGSKTSEKAYIEQVKAWARKPSDQYAGEEISFSHADGYACYIVLTSKPVVLIHLEIGDCWDSPLADKITAKELIKKIENNKKINELFPKR
jgi:hypothetical protein